MTIKAWGVGLLLILVAAVQAAELEEQGSRGCGLALHEREWHGILSWVMEGFANISLLTIGIVVLRYQVFLAHERRYRPRRAIPQYRFMGEAPELLPGRETPPPTYRVSQWPGDPRLITPVRIIESDIPIRRGQRNAD